MKTTPRLLRWATVSALIFAPLVHAQTSADSDSSDPDQPNENEVFLLSPFEVSTSEDNNSYTAASTLAGNRLNTRLKDVGSAVSVVTPRFLKDVGASDNSSLLAYTLGTEVGGTNGNFAGVGDTASLNEDTLRPNANTRVRGLAAADNTRDFFRTEIPWDSYNVDRVDLQRGPNSILFGQGSPAGIINTGLRGANFYDSGEVELRLDNYGSQRVSLDVNRELIDDQVALRISALRDDEQFKQDPAYNFDRRIYGAIRIEPELLKRGHAHTIFKANVETGSIDSNNPRQLPPTDTITPWFTELDQETYNPFQLWDHLSGRENHGQERPEYAAPLSGPIPWYTPWVGGFGTPAVEAQPVAFFSGSGQSLWITEASQSLIPHALGPDGTPDGGFASMPQQRMRGINTTSLWAAEANLPYSQSGLYKDNVITDPTLFDFYNNLIDGDTKHEWQDFTVYNLSLSQTFFDDTVGFALDYNNEHYENGQLALLGGNVALGIDFMSVFADGTPDAGLNGGEPYSDGTPNPNVGRPFVSSKNQGNHSYESDREAKRATGFIKHDFTKDGDNWFYRFLGTHTITGLLADESLNSDTRVWQRYGIFDDAAYTELEEQPLSTKFDHVWMTPQSVVYLGDSLLGRSASGAHIPSVSGDIGMQSGQIRYFDDHWKWSLDPADPDYVDPGAPWTNGFYIPGNAASDAMNSTQSENPANYVGWTTFPLTITDSEESAANRDKLTTSASLRKSVTKSQALVWQGKFLEDSIVGIYGWRKDVNKSWAYDTNTSSSNGVHGQLDLSPDSYRLPYEYDRVEVESRSYSIVVHLTDLPWLRKATQRVPFDFSVFYNESSNFKPDASRKDIYGEPIPSPAGETTDKGFMISTRDGRYSLRVTRYETEVTNATSTALNDPNAIGTWMQMGANFVNVFEYDIGGGGFVASPDVIGTGDPQRYNFRNADGTWDTEGEAAAIAGFREFQRAVDPRFYDAWGMDVQGFGAPTHEITASAPAGFTVTEDSISRGWEFELNAQPTDNWRLAVNASQSEAYRYNIGGANMIEFMNLVADAVAGDAGQLHYWWGTADVPRAINTWYGPYIGAPGSDWISKKLLEDTKVPELREWRVNLVTNYDFTEGLIKGVNVGAGMRYQSSVVIGFPPNGDPYDPADNSVDLSSPYKGPAETNYDFWIGYTRDLTDSIRWNLQFNVRNAFSDNELIPITVQPDGTPAAYRIAPPRTFFVTSRFEF
ncbi:MAG: TonB-dependent receptor plug [Puniceicoccaceae bacterium 5H]|nr:MAG: TonB-dependent receptor plug [Puniceicoccaceae bacterium 5H]